MDEADAILWGATGGPEIKEVPPEARKAGGLLRYEENKIFSAIFARFVPAL